MKFLFFFIVSVFLILSMEISSQTIPGERVVDWKTIRNNIQYKQPLIQLNVQDFGATGDGITNDYPAIMSAIENLNGYYGFIYFPAGDYLVNGTIILPDSCILKGDGSDNSVLTFDLGNEAAHCITISKSQTSDFVAITGGLQKGSNSITVSDVQEFKQGDIIEIRQKNGDWDVVPISWADYSVGQMTRVDTIIDNEIFLESELRIDYYSDLEPEVRPVVPITNAGLQCIKIRRVDEPEESAGFNIYMNMAVDCYVRGVESDLSNSAHLSVFSGLNILVDGSYFHHSFKYDGEGMRGYGIALSNHTSECLITNNIFRKLRHAMMIKTGSNGNIFSYNYSIEPLRTEPVPDASGDISFHGHYAFSNLWEGNIVQNIVIDHYWGPSGPYNTLFRNRAENYGIIMTSNDIQETNTQNFVGNETTNTEFLHGLYNLTGEDHFEYGNNIIGVVTPPGTHDLPDSSYYLISAPGFWTNNINWPPIGLPNTLGDGTIPARLRYNGFTEFTVCPDSLITDYHYNSFEAYTDFSIWPVPTRNVLNLKFKHEPESNALVYMSDTFGRVVYSNNFNTQESGILKIITAGLTPGIYFITVITNQGSGTKKLLLSDL